MFPVVEFKGGSESENLSSEGRADVVIVLFAKGSRFKAIKSSNLIAISV